MDARLIYVFGTAEHEDARTQLASLLADPEGTRRHDIGVVDVDAMPQVKLWHDHFEVPDGTFATVLTDREGVEIWRGDAPVEPADIWAVLESVGRG